MFMKSCRRHNEDRGIDEQGEHKRHARVDGCELDRLRSTGAALLVIARLHDRGMEIEIMRHHRRAENANRDVKHVAVADDFSMRRKTA